MRPIVLVIARRQYADQLARNARNAKVYTYCCNLDPDRAEDPRVAREGEG